LLESLLADPLDGLRLALQSVELRDDFAIAGFALTVIFIVCVLGTLGFSVGLLVLQLDQDRRQRLGEARAARARRLRLLKDGTEVTLNTLLTGAAKEKLLKNLHPKTNDAGIIPHVGPFHIFCMPAKAEPLSRAARVTFVYPRVCPVSHNWQHGQSTMRVVKSRLQELLPDVEVRHLPMHTFCFSPMRRSLCWHRYFSTSIS
jgi:hypothetical protein